MNMQEWITINGTRRLVVRRKLSNECRRCVVLLSGFSQSMCDKNYFMYRLGTDILPTDIEVIHYDPIAHGESCFCLEDINLAAYRNDLRSLLCYIKERHGAIPIVVARGFAASIIAGMPRICDMLVGILPFYISDATKKHISEVVENIKTDIIEFSDFNQTDLIFKNFIDALGAHYNNLTGQLISKKFLTEMINLNLSYISKKNYVCIAPDVENGFQSFSFCDYKKAIDINTMPIKFNDDAKTIDNLIKIIISTLADIVREDGQK